MIFFFFALSIFHYSNIPVCSLCERQRKVLFLFGALEDETGNVFFPLEVTVIDQGGKPDQRGPHNKAGNQRVSPGTHLFFFSCPGLTHAAGQGKILLHPLSIRLSEEMKNPKAAIGLAKDEYFLAMQRSGLRGGFVLVRMQVGEVQPF
jgi:hypothetical protein